MIKHNSLFFAILMLLPFSMLVKSEVQETVMQKIYEEVKTPYKYGLVLLPGDLYKMVDSPQYLPS